MPSSAKATSGALPATKGTAPSSPVYLCIPTDTSLRHHTQLSLMSLPNECLMLIIQGVASQGAQDLFSLLCVNKTFFYLVVPLLYRDPFRLCSRWVWKRSGYKGVIERQTKLIRTLLLCCTRTINKITPIDPQLETKKKKHGQAFWSETPLGRAMAVVRRSDKNPPAIHHGVISAQSSDSRRDHGFEGSSTLTTISEGTTLDPHESGRRFNCMGVSPQKEKGDRSIFKSFFHKLGHSSNSSSQRTAATISATESIGEQAKQQQPKPGHLTTIEKIPIIWDADKNQPETQRIPGLGLPNSPRLKFPPELTKTIIRLANEPPPIVNYLSYVTHTDVRSWSAASNMTLVHQILGDARSSWHARLHGLVKKTSRKIMGKQSASDRQAGGSTTTNSIYDNRTDMDDIEDEDEGGPEMAFNFRRDNRNRRWKRGRGTRNKNLWELRDIDFLELLLLFYTSGKMESLSLGMNCSHWYHPSLNVLLKGIPERLSGLRRIVIEHADTIANNATPVPQVFIQRHQKAFPGQLREIQVRQSYHYAYDMSKSVLQTIKTMERLEVLDLSIWTGVFSGLETVCTEHLRKLLICHHMEVPRPDMFDELLKACPVLEELSIVVPHPRLFSWAAERRRHLQAGLPGKGSIATATGAKAKGKTTALSSSTAGIQSLENLPPLRILTLFGHTPDVLGAFKDVIYAFQDTLESIQISMYSDMTKPTETHFEVPASHFVVAEEMPQPAFFGINSLQNPLQQQQQQPEQQQEQQQQQQPGSALPAASQPSPDVYTSGAGYSPLWTGHHAVQASGSGTSSSSSSSSTPSSYLFWNWPLPRMRTMSLRGPPVAAFDMQLLRFCPQLTDLSLSCHCSRLPRLAYPGSFTSKSGATGTFTTMATTAMTTTRTTRYPRIMICDALAFKWGMSVQEERRSVILV
ncbi:MAG: hypothetical protein J3Q66DRAFT_359097 [Benniella sp.]|nr:MAG: hypothetical protein J3Q66DRAFT_359097 [Benniella sp.]